MWGQESRLVLFYLYQSSSNGLAAFGRCTGHAGAPVRLASAAYPNEDVPWRVEYWDNPDLHPERFRELVDGTRVGTNGFAEMTIQGPSLTLEYFDADRTSVFKESFAPRGEGVWDGTLARTVSHDPGILNLMIYQ